MAENLIDLAEDAECVAGPTSKSKDFYDFPQTLVTEKIIFCIDIMLMSNENETLIHSVLYLLKAYFNLKKKICVKPPEFECLLIINGDEIIHSYINSVKDLQAAVLTIKRLEFQEEKQPLQMDKIFTEIAKIVELPDPKCYQKCLPPPWVYHVIWLFGHNLHVPKMEDTNSFDYLMMTPFVAIDFLYMYDNSLENNQCEQISQALASLNENGQGYFLSVNINQKEKMLTCVSQLLGHPLIRSPQSQAKFNIMELGLQFENIVKENVEV